VARQPRRAFCRPGTKFGECWRVRGTKFSKWHVIIPGIVISVTAVARRVLSPDILIPVNGSEAMQKA